MELDLPMKWDEGGMMTLCEVAFENAPLAVENERITEWIIFYLSLQLASDGKKLWARFNTGFDMWCLLYWHLIVNAPFFAVRRNAWQNTWHTWTCTTCYKIHLELGTGWAAKAPTCHRTPTREAGLLDFWVSNVSQHRSSVAMDIYAVMNDTLEHPRKSEVRAFFCFLASTYAAIVDSLCKRHWPLSWSLARWE